jgi:DNA-binding HxlR family transcriptional regulator
MRKSSSTHLTHELKLISRCPIMSAQTLLKGRWKLPMLWNLREGPRSLAQLLRILPLASERMLTLHLRELVRDGFVVRSTKAGDARRVDYSLSQLGHSLLPTLDSLIAWGEQAGVVARACRSLRSSVAD